jgi:hypothetical protein
MHAHLAVHFDILHAGHGCGGFLNVYSSLRGAVGRLRGFGACGSQSYQHATNEATAELYIATMSFSERTLGTGK